MRILRLYLSHDRLHVWTPTSSSFTCHLIHLHFVILIDILLLLNLTLCYIYHFLHGALLPTSSHICRILLTTSVLTFAFSFSSLFVFLFTLGLKFFVNIYKLFGSPTSWTLELILLVLIALNFLFFFGFFLFFFDFFFSFFLDFGWCLFASNLIIIFLSFWVGGFIALFLLGSSAWLAFSFFFFFKFFLSFLA